MIKTLKEIRIAVCAAGTGGHIYPGIAVARSILKDRPDAKILFFGSGKKIEKSIFNSEGLDANYILSSGLQKTTPFDILKALVLYPAGLFQAAVKLLFFKPDVLLSTGGYSSLPVVFAAVMLNVPVILHEQNVLPGRANRIVSKLAKKIAVSFEESAKYFDPARTVVTGNPVREGIVSANGQVSKNKLGINPGAKTVLVVGGSQGARSLNKYILEAVPLMKDRNITLVHLCGESDFILLEDKIAGIDKGILSIKLFPYTHDMGTVLAASDLVISRAGATILAEIASRGLPSVLAPYPHAAEDHQRYNAEVFGKKGASLVIEDASLSGKMLSDMIKDLLSDRGRYEKMSAAARSMYKSDAASKIKELIYETV
ncbi:MAG: undecaprenyldiphospho-muramoylpentapeptide beta-N-acetylglucosaminyltransferase [Candidatus Saganbacteria bacterium]|nr:undecaprenyldiphospho-muramoylpentapeptide beta-N-acetylglucosaminyltransferase [Candidatus Saganbacteria bacterium]